MSCRPILTQTDHMIEQPYLKLPYTEITFDGGSLRYASQDKLSRKRVTTLFTKEPSTIWWMDSFQPGEVMFDVGANVGMYTIYAAGACGARVYAFEPESQNYGELNRNIFLNGLNERVTAYNIAASNAFEMSTIFLSYFATGSSHHDFGENRWDGDMVLGPVAVKRDERLQQGCTSMRLDDVVGQMGLPMPHHVKVDVDGFEWKVVEGARDLLQGDHLKTVLIETDNKLKESKAIIETMISWGWKYSLDQMRVNQHEVMSLERLHGLMERRKGGQNIIWFKDDVYSDLFRRYAESFVPPNPHAA